ncbi:MAG: peptidoglycan editing factor PgeF [Anaerobacillus sp.]
MKKEPFQSTTKMTSLELEFPDQAMRERRIIAGFSTRKNGVSQTPFSSLNLGFHVPDDACDVLENRIILAKDIGIDLDNWVVGEQVHGSAITKISSGDIGRGTRNHQDAIEKVDGLYTEDENILLTALYADCVPLYFYAPAARRVGIAHAGWKGTTKNIAREMIRVWNNDGIQSEDIFAVIGPSIGRCCYEVNDVVIDQVNAAVGEGQAFYETKSNGKYQLDLKALNKELFLKAGIKENHLSVSDYCTSCSNLFFSHRNENGRTGRMMGYIGLREV